MNSKIQRYWFKRFVDGGILNESGIWIYQEQLKYVEAFVRIIALNGDLVLVKMKR